MKARYPNDKTGQINTVLGENPLLFDRYLSNATEVDVDCLVRRHDRVRRRHHGAHRGGRHPFGRFGLLAAAALALAGDHRRDRGADQEAGAGAERRRTDERAICHQGWADLRAGGEPARLAHRALRRQGDRQAARQDRVAASWRARVWPASDLTSTPTRSMSASRRRSSPSRASPTSTPCSARRCARPARSSGSTARSTWPSPRASSAAAPRCRSRARSSCR